MVRPTQTWKTSERNMAKSLGGVRVPVSGRNRGDVPDIDHPQLSIEHKYGKVISARIQTAFKQAQAVTDKHGGIPVVTFEHVVPPGGSNGSNKNIVGVAMTLDNFKIIARMAGIQLETRFNPIDPED